jgi:hypothetical protein
MSERLNIEDYKNAEEVVINPETIHDECLIDADEQIEHPPIAISIGYKYDGNVPLVTYGNICCIVGASKSMKSFFKSALVACYIGGKAQTYFPDIKGHQTKGKYVIDVDTEQGKYHVQKVVKRTHTMIGGGYKGYKGFALRSKTPKERVTFIEWILKESVYAGNIGLLSIDGVADLIDNVNDLDSSNYITQKLMTWSNDYNIAIITILHKNFDSERPTGHLGSAILKKSETVIFVNKEDAVVQVTAKYSRNIPFDDFSFTVDEHGIPHETGVNY